MKKLVLAMLALPTLFISISALAFGLPFYSYLCRFNDAVMGRDY